MNRLAKKTINLSSTNKIPLKTNVIDGSILSGGRHPIMYTLVLDKPVGYKVLSSPETIH